ncbi:unnamed protein product [Parnassius mnemosyne]|uniref:DDE Tnp4 domain-containing protein n=1 Tax=Parnassius mnemosyne TaxID=213953 RepID=A0AAV1LES2_9NEOP
MSEERRRMLLALAAVCIYDKEREKKNRRCWAKKWLLQRPRYSHINLMAELALQEPNDFRNYLRLDSCTYQQLLSLLEPMLTKQDTCMRKAITAHERLSATLRFLATGRSYEDLQYSVAISKQSLSKIIPETCDAIIATLQEEYLKFPETEEEWLDIAKTFEERWQFPHCLGAIDGKHVKIVPPANSGSYYFNYKKDFSVVLLAIANANYEFIMVDIGINGRISDGGVINRSIFYEKLNTGSLNIPRVARIMNSETVLPYVFVGDDAFSLRPDLMKPYPGPYLSPQQRIFNYRLSRARRIIENIFGILVNRFRIFRTSIKTIDKIVMAACILHNFLRRNCNQYIRVGVDIENLEDGNISTGYRANNELLGLQITNQGQSQTMARYVRDQYMQYFNNEGSVLWQNRFTNLNTFT